MKSTFADYVVNDLLAGVEGIRARAMFGGYGIYAHETMFAIIVDDELYYKVGKSNSEDFESHGSKPFQYKAKGGKRVSMSYWKLPAEIMDDQSALETWTSKAIDAAHKAIINRTASTGGSKAHRALMEGKTPTQNKESV